MEQLLGVHTGTTSLESCVAVHCSDTGGQGDDTCHALTRATHPAHVPWRKACTRAPAGSLEQDVCACAAGARTGSGVVHPQNSTQQRGERTANTWPCGHTSQTLDKGRQTRTTCGGSHICEARKPAGWPSIIQGCTSGQHYLEKQGHGDPQGQRSDHYWGCDQEGDRGLPGC